MQDKEYKILEVTERNKWSGKFGEFQDYALKLEGVDGYVQLSQKPETPAPNVGDSLYGHTETQTRGENTFLKFKKVQRPDTTGNSNRGSSSNEDTKYIIQMLEELTDRRKKPDSLPDDEDIAGEPIDLAEIPF